MAVRRGEKPATRWRLRAREQFFPMCILPLFFFNAEGHSRKSDKGRARGRLGDCAPDLSTVDRIGFQNQAKYHFAETSPDISPSRFSVSRSLSLVFSRSQTAACPRLRTTERSSASASLALATVPRRSSKACSTTRSAPMTTCVLSTYIMQWSCSPTPLCLAHALDVRLCHTEL